MFKILYLVLLLLSCLCALDPSTFSQQLHSITPPGITIIQEDLGRTINGYNVIAYGITALNPLPEKIELESFSSYPSSLILSLMHGTDVNAFNLLYGYVVNLIRVYDQDYYVQMVLKNGIVWLVPFISIQTYEFAVKKFGKDGLNFSSLSMKNMNKFPDENNQIECETKFPGKFSGVNLNYNFLIQSQQAHLDVCSNEYSGPYVYSQRQTLAIRKLFDTLKITTVIDLQIGDNKWVHPHTGIWQKNHKFDYMYKDIISKIEKGSFKIEEQPTKQITLKKSTSKKTIEKQGYSGGFINWAALKNTVAMKYLISPEGKGQKFIESVTGAYSVIDMLIKKNAPVYNKYRSEDSKTFFIQSISMNKFTVKCEVLFPDESKTKQYQVSFGKMVEIDLAKAYKKGDKLPEIRIYIVGTPIVEVIDIGQLPSVKQLPDELIPAQSSSNYEDEGSNDGNSSIFSSWMLWVILAGIVLCGAKLFISGWNEKKQYVGLQEDGEVN